METDRQTVLINLFILEKTDGRKKDKVERFVLLIPHIITFPVCFTGFKNPFAGWPNGERKDGVCSEELNDAFGSRKAWIEDEVKSPGAPGGSCSTFCSGRARYATSCPPWWRRLQNHRRGPKKLQRFIWKQHFPNPLQFFLRFRSCFCLWADCRPRRPPSAFTECFWWMWSSTPPPTLHQCCIFIKLHLHGDGVQRQQTTVDSWVVVDQVEQGWVNSHGPCGAAEGGGASSRTCDKSFIPTEEEEELAVYLVSWRE